MVRLRNRARTTYPHTGARMSLLPFMVRNLLRQPVHTALTLLGVALGVATVIALGTVTESVRDSAMETIEAGGGDFVVAQRTSAGLTFSSITEEDWHAIEARPEIERALAAVLSISRVGPDPYFRTVGVDPVQLPLEPPTLRSGRLLAPGAPDEVLLGSRAASNLHAVIDDYISISNHTFKVVGIYHTGNLWQDGGAYAPIATVQEMAAKPGVVTLLWAGVRPGFEAEAVARGLERDYPHLLTISGLQELTEVDQGLRVVDASNLAVSMLAIAIGALGVLNTMARSVFERTREIGVLRAVGWSGQRVIGMVVGESMLLCTAAAAVGAAMGVAAMQAVLLEPTVHSIIEPRYTAPVFARALLIALGVALAGAAYPAFRAVRLRPIDALRYE